MGLRELSKEMIEAYPSEEFGKETRKQLKYVAENTDLLLAELEEPEKLEHVHSESQQLSSSNSPKKIHVRSAYSGDESIKIDVDDLEILKQFIEKEKELSRNSRYMDKLRAELKDELRAEVRNEVKIEVWDEILDLLMKELKNSLDDVRPRPKFSRFENFFGKADVSTNTIWKELESKNT